MTTPAHVALANQVAESGTTLLKNAGAVLHATATTGDWLREAGVNVTVSV